MIGGKLEALAEEIVAILNEDARDAAQKLKAFMGEATTDVDIKVDTLPYDVSVFALGAFGMSVMVLSNLLVGGLLTLAAPLLALVFKDRVDKEVKKKATANSPDVVRQVARKIEPELTGTIDRFGEKLSEFVATATEELRRSMIEVLNTTRVALAEAKAGVEPPVQEVDTLLEQARGVQSRVEQLRAESLGDAAGVKICRIIGSTRGGGVIVDV